VAAVTPTILGTAIYGRARYAATRPPIASAISDIVAFLGVRTFEALLSVRSMLIFSPDRTFQSEAAERSMLNFSPERTIKSDLRPRRR